MLRFHAAIFAACFHAAAIRRLFACPADARIMRRDAPRSRAITRGAR
jgi:hypothetical protein